jgi:hypothetical protein
LLVQARHAKLSLLAPRKKTSGGTSPRTSAREFAVVLEDVRSQFKVFGEAFLGLRDQMTAGFEQVDRRFEQVDGEIGLLKAAVIEQSRELREIRVAVSRLEDKVDKKVDRVEVEAIVEEVLARPRPH